VAAQGRAQHPRWVAAKGRPGSSPGTSAARVGGGADAGAAARRSHRARLSWDDERALLRRRGRRERAECRKRASRTLCGEARSADSPLWLGLATQSGDREMHGWRLSTTCRRAGGPSFRTLASLTVDGPSMHALTASGSAPPTFWRPATRPARVREPVLHRCDAIQIAPSARAGASGATKPERC
jgi:hypothetical protein